MEINFKCTSCKSTFDFNVGKIGTNWETLRPIFENEIICPNCGIRTIDQVRLTELGQSQMTIATLSQ